MAIDALTTATQQLVLAYNNNTKAIQYNAGQFTTITYTQNPAFPGYLVVTGPGRIVSASIVISGAGTVSIYNSSTVNLINPSNLLYVFPENAPIGITQIGKQFTGGLVVIIGAGVSACFTYSVGATVG